MVFQFFLQHRHHERHIYGHQRCQIISDEQYVADETDQSSNFPLFNFQSSISYWFSQLKPRITSQAMHCTSYNIYIYIQTHTSFCKLQGDLNLPIWMKFIVQQIFNVEMAMVTSSDWVPLCFPVYRFSPGFAQWWCLCHGNSVSKQLSIISQLTHNFLPGERTEW